MFTSEAFFFGLTQGFVIGPLTLYAIKEGLNPHHGFWKQIQVVLGSCVADIIYLCLATYGVTHFIEYGWVRIAMWTAGSYMLIHMGLNTLRQRAGKMNLHHVHRHKMRLFDTDFFRGLVVSLTNPMAVVFSFVVVGSLYASYAGSVGPGMFAMNVNLGGLVSGIIVSVVTMVCRHFLKQEHIKKVVSLSSLILIGYGLSFAYKAVIEAAPTIKTVTTSILHLVG